MEIISTELRLKDIEWVEKTLEALKKGKPLTNTSMADKLKKEEIACTEKVLDLIKNQGKDVRKGDWNNKEVWLSMFARLSCQTRCSPSIHSIDRLCQPNATPHRQARHLSRQLV